MEKQELRSRETFAFMTLLLFICYTHIRKWDRLGPIYWLRDHSAHQSLPPSGWISFLPKTRCQKQTILGLLNSLNQVWVCPKMFLGMGYNNAGGHQWPNHHTLTSGQASRSKGHPGPSWTPCEMEQVRNMPPEVGSGVPQTEFAIIHRASTTNLSEKSHWLEAQPLTD